MKKIFSIALVLFSATLFAQPTLTHTIVPSIGNTVQTLSNQEFNHHKLPKDHSYDFSEFRNAEKFHKEGEPIHPMINKLKAIHKNAEKKGGDIYFWQHRHCIDCNIATRRKVVGGLIS